MSELQHYLRPRPALEPIRTKGNAFWREDDRFLIKGINYFHRLSKDGRKPTVHDPKVDPLEEEHLSKLRRDIEYFQELGLNTVAVSQLDPSKSHHKALKLLAENGFYVLVKISEQIHQPDFRTNNQDFVQDFDTAPYYTLDTITPSLRLVDELADYPNILGFMVSGDSLRYNSTSKIASVVRAHIRDIKHFLHLRGGRHVPVGVTNSEILLLRYPALQYFTAGPRSSRIDFFAPDSWSWANPSSFQISGWKNMTERMGEVPVPMFLRQFGTFVGKERTWSEVECLFSREMTGVFSGGCAYAFCDPGHGEYGIVEIDERTGKVREKREFGWLKEKFGVVNQRTEEEVFGEEMVVKDYEGWEGTFPERVENRWMATEEIPAFAGDWEAVMKDVERQREMRSSEADVPSLIDQASRLHLND